MSENQMIEHTCPACGHIGRALNRADGTACLACWGSGTAPVKWVWMLPSKDGKILNPETPTKDEEFKEHTCPECAHTINAFPDPLRGVPCPQCLAPQAGGESWRLILMLPSKDGKILGEAGPPGKLGEAGEPVVAEAPKGCSCWSDLNTNLKSRHGLQISSACEMFAITEEGLEHRYCLPLSREGGMKLKKSDPKNITISHCPFCGKAL